MSAFYRADWVAPYIRDHFVPVAVDSYVPGDASEAAFFKLVQKGVNNFAYATAGGKVLAYDGCDDMKSHLKAAVEKFRALPESERKPALEKATPSTPLAAGGGGGKRAYRMPPEGGLVARVYCTYLDRDEKGGHSRAKSMYQNTHDGQPTNRVEPALTWIDMLWLTREEWQSLVPANPRKGETFAASAGVQRRFFRYYAADLHRRPVDRVREGTLTLTVEETTAEGTTLRLDGHAKTGAEFDAANPLQGYRRGTVGGPGNSETPKLHGAEFRFLGHLRYDAKKGAFDRFEMVGLGEAWGWFTEGYRGGGERRRWPLGLSFEMVSGERPVDRVTPFGALPYAFGDSYFKGN